MASNLTQPATEPTTPLLPLADIHLQAAPSWWPLAWGWWVLAAVVLFTVAGTLFLIKKRNANHAAKKEALQLLQTSAYQNDIAMVSELLKQAAMSYFSRGRVASLNGAQWLHFLDQQLPAKYRKSHGFQAKEAEWLAALYAPTASLPADTQKMCLEQAKIWLTHALPPKKGNQNV
ncbi:DUF4381 domain-containing protein [Vibrio sp. Of7-15]|uniref:DUF4381 domain-containing protein n=1 Tax=Vibrio sp. Of7-15 TaxID=2724879 RepID=UPI001EF341E2|nr:DUF4381 domain-containing protein [Vibrio sp. Of7-15]